jgi:hypothetical protein
MKIKTDVVERCLACRKAARGTGAEAQSTDAQLGGTPATRPAFARRALRVVLHPNAAVRASLTAADTRVRLESAAFGAAFSRSCAAPHPPA